MFLLKSLEVSPINPLSDVIKLCLNIFLMLDRKTEGQYLVTDRKNKERKEERQTDRQKGGRTDGRKTDRMNEGR